MLIFTEEIPLSLYIHLPWCIRKCPYCDFNSHETKKLEEKKYINALIRDLESQLPHIRDRKIISIFIGGGTPSLFSPEALDKLINLVKEKLNFHPKIEITLEANPGSAEAKKFEEYFLTGINRLSIGVQSFNDKHLKKLGRVHSAKEAHNAIDIAKEVMFDNFNIDLMFGLPGQSIDEAIQDIETAISEKPKHLSWYQFTIEPNTVFYAKPPTLPDDDTIWEMQCEGKILLGNNGLTQYEISAYSSEKYQCQHNLNYWMFGDYLGIGAGSHSKITNIAKAKIERFTRHKIPKSYMAFSGMDRVITEKRELTRDDLPLEFMMNAFRLTEGVPKQLFIDRTGLLLNEVEKELSIAKEKEWLNWQSNRLKPTETGQRYLNDLLALFIK